MDELPRWEQTPSDLPTATKEIKAALRDRIAASGRTVEEVVAVLNGISWPRWRRSRPPATGASRSGRSSTTPTSLRARSPPRPGACCAGAAVPWPRAVRARPGQGWDTELVDYVDRNGFAEQYRGPADDFFASVGSKPEIYPIYWSRPQMEARQSDEMAGPSVPQRAVATRVGRRAVVRPGPRLAVPGPHPAAATRDQLGRAGQPPRPGHARPVDDPRLPAGLPASVRRHGGAVRPMGRRVRTAGPQYPGTTMCSVFRTFQGWTALSDMAHDQGVLHTVPIPGAMAYLMLRPLLPDVPDDDMCGVTLNRTFPVTEQWHPLLRRALTGIPDVRAGDTVWWHCDLIHSVAPVEDQQGWGNVMYIPAAPWCPRNERYAARVRAAFEAGSSPTTSRPSTTSAMGGPLHRRRPERDRTAGPGPAVMGPAWTDGPP